MRRSARVCVWALGMRRAPFRHGAGQQADSAAPAFSLDHAKMRTERRRVAKIILRTHCNVSLKLVVKSKNPEPGAWEALRRIAHLASGMLYIGLRVLANLGCVSQNSEIVCSTRPTRTCLLKLSTPREECDRRNGCRTLDPVESWE